MKRSLIFKLALMFSLFLGSNLEPAVAGGPATATGIPLDQPWKAYVYQFAQKNVVHPSWGIAHSERDYQNTAMLAQAEGVDMDLDVLFASAFLHDLGGIGSFQVPGVDHAVRSAQLVGDILQSAGFPMEKLDQVKEMILGHTYYGPVPQSKSALLFRDADILDFLGVMGITRILAITEEPGRSMTLTSALQLINQFSDEMPAKLSSPAAKEAAVKRVADMKAYMEILAPYTFGGQAL